MRHVPLRHALLAASLLLAGSALAPAAAQYYGPPAYGPPGYDPGYDGPRRFRREYDGPPAYSPYGPPRRRSSTVCVTARGPCPIGDVVPRGWPCGCIVPGFGYKRGNAG